MDDAGGWVGYFSYDTVRYVERKKLSFESAPMDDRGLPDLHLGLYNDVIVFDHVSKVNFASLPTPCRLFVQCHFGFVRKVY